MRIVSWNINSVRLRIDTLKKVADALQPDFMCLQETKAQDSDFPTDAITEAGFTRQLVRGMKGYNGVAILSNAAMSDGGSRDWCAREDCRHVAADIGDKTFCIISTSPPAAMSRTRRSTKSSRTRWTS